VVIQEVARHIDIGVPVPQLEAGVLAMPNQIPEIMSIDDIKTDPTGRSKIIKL